MTRTLLYTAGALLISLPCLAAGDWAFPEQNLDRSVSPSADFYEFAVGGWRKEHPIPPDRARWGVFDVLASQTSDRLHTILEQASTAHAPAGSDVRKIGDLYLSGMNEEILNALGPKPITPELSLIDTIADLDDLQAEIAHLQGIGENAAFDFGQMPDPKSSTVSVGAADQAGLGLPDRADYLDDTARNKELRRAYVVHVAAMLKLAGEPEDRAGRDAAAVLSIETDLARASLGRVERRDPYAVYHPTDLAGLAELTPHFSWPRYFALIDHPQIDRVNVIAPRFFKELDRLLTTVSLDDWKGYLRWHLVDLAAPYLSDDFVREDFAFHSRITGVEALLPRWKRVLAAENRALGFALGKLYVEQYFSAPEKARATVLLSDIQATLRTDLQTLAWMTPATRQRATEKLDLMAEQVGYPDRWIDYSRLVIDPDIYAVNMMRSAAFNWRRELDKIGKPVDRGEWSMTPQTVNAYYDPSLNKMVFPAGILQPPFFDASAPAAWNYGAVGVVMGHEITHGFDDEGSRYDGHGNLVDWWTPEDFARFHDRTKCIADQFSGFTVAEGTRVNGALVTGEATADLGGVTLALTAYDAMASGHVAEEISGFTPRQIFFLSFANIWAANTRPEEAVLLARTDPHPPARFRVNGTLANVPEFQQAFEVPAGSPMMHEPRCDIW